jgi:hypothetical protein
MATELPNKMTPISASDAAKSLSQAYKDVVGKKVSSKILLLLLLQWATETGNGKFVHNYNFGNEKYGGQPYYQYFEGGETVNGQDVRSVMKWAAYPNAIEGAKGFIAILKKRPQWWKGLQTGDLVKYVDGLVSVVGQYYFTASKSRYLASMQSNVEKYLPYAKQFGTSPWGTFVQVVLGLAVGAAGVYTARELRKPKKVRV